MSFIFDLPDKIFKNFVDKNEFQGDEYYINEIIDNSDNHRRFYKFSYDNECYLASVVKVEGPDYTYTSIILPLPNIDDFLNSIDEESCNEFMKNKWSLSDIRSELKYRYMKFTYIIDYDKKEFSLLFYPDPRVTDNKDHLLVTWIDVKASVCSDVIIYNVYGNRYDLQHYS